MADLATLGISVKTDADQATMQLDKLSGAAKRAEAAANGVASANQNGSGAARAAAAALNGEAVAAKAAALALMQTAGAARMAANNQRMMMFQINDVATMLAMGASPFQILASQGGQIVQIYSGQGGVRAALDDTVGALGRVVRAHPALAAATLAVSAAFAGLTYEINQASSVSVGLGDTMLAVFQVIGSGIYDFIQPAVEAIAPWFASAWDMVVSGTKAFGNTFIQAILGSIEMVKFAVMSLPDVFIVAGESAANGFLVAIEDMVQETVAVVNGLIRKINGALRAAGLEGQIGDLGDPNSISVGRLDIGGGAASDRLSAGYAGMNSRIAGIVGTDYMGNFFDAVKVQAVANAMGKVDEATKKAGDTTKEAANGWRSYGNAARRAIEDTINFAQDLARGFISDLRSGLEEGKGIWGSFADAAMNALDKITEKLIAMATDQLIVNLLGSLFGGGFLSPRAYGAIQSGGGGLYADGGYTGAGGKYEPAGTVHKGEYVFSAAAVRAIGVGNLDRQHRSARRGMASGGYAGGAAIRMHSPANTDGGVRIENHIHNNAGAEVRQEERQRGDGTVELHTYIDAKVSQLLSTQGTKSNRALRAMGGRAPLKNVGG